MTRDPLAERGLLARAQHLARLVAAAWPRAVERRLALGQDRYGDAWSKRSAAELLAEAGEEAEDLAAWSCLAAQQLSASDLNADAIAAIGELVVHAVGAAAEAAAYLSAAETALSKATR